MRVVGNEWACATSAGAYSSSALVNDTVLRATAQLHLQSGSGASAITINSSNVVFVRNNLEVLGTALVSGNVGVTGFVAAAPRYGRRYKSGAQGITTGATSWQTVTWTDAVSGPLTSSSGTTYTNSTGFTLQIQVNTAIAWDPYFAGGWAAARVLLSNGDVYGNSSTFLSPGTISMSTTTAIFSLANTQSFTVQAVHDRPVTMSILGGVDGANEICTMSYYILN